MLIQILLVVDTASGAVMIGIEVEAVGAGDFDTIREVHMHAFAIE